MIWLFLVCAVLLVSVSVLGIKILIMRRAAREISREFSEKLKSDTNTLISVSTEDKAMCCLADDINAELGELRKQRHRFIQGDLELKNAVTNISHDLRTPITAISSYLDLLEKTDKSEPAERYIEVIRNRTEALSRLTEELLQYSALTASKGNVETEPVVVNRVLEESILGFYAALQEKGISPAIIMTEKRVVRNLNRDSLSRIFSNLLSNAVRYSDGDLDIVLSDDGKIVFSNTASGLNEIQVERLFDRFYTLENARKTTGLGLSIARILTEQMKGIITAKYREGKLYIELILPADRIYL